MSGAIVAMLVSAWIVDGTLDAALFGIFSVATAASGLIAFLVFKSIDSGKAAA